MHLAIKEWESRSFADTAALRGVELTPEARSVAEALTYSERLKVIELRAGMRISATSYVGRVELDALVITITPKLAPDHLLRLFAYAYGLDDLHLLADTAYGASQALFVDVVVQRLLAEVRRLRERGLHRAYVRVAEDLVTPRGAIDMRRAAGLAARGAVVVPCVHHPREHDNLLNRVVRAGLILAAETAVGDLTRGHARRAATELEGISRVRLSTALLGRAARAVDRRTAHYAPVLRLIEILLAGTALDLDGDQADLRVPGFLFDMNRFWQVLLGRLMRDNLEEVDVLKEHGPRGVLRYARGAAHPHRPPPQVRPDFVLKRGAQTIAVLDAKYRDLWARTLPREMLYQLTTYAAMQGPGGIASMLYPTDAADARDVRIELAPGAATTTPVASVVLRPVRVAELVHHISCGDAGGPGRRAWVRQLVGL